MREDEREHRLDDSTPRTGDGDHGTPQVPTVRLLANPRRVRRA